MTNRNDNRERRNKYPNNQKQDTEISKEVNLSSDVTIPSDISKRQSKNKTE